MPSGRVRFVCHAALSAVMMAAASARAGDVFERGASGAGGQVAGALTGGWRLSLEPSIWAPGLGGDLGFGAGDFQVERLRVDDARASALLRVQARRGDLVLDASGFVFSFDDATRTDAVQSAGGLAFAAGDPARVRFDLVSAELTVGARVWGVSLPGPGAGRVVKIGVDAFGGLRAYSLDALVGSPGGGTRSGDGLWVEPIVGARLNVDLLNSAGFFLTLDAGAMPIGDHTSTSFDIVTGIQWRPLRLVGVQFGWRQLLVDLQDGDGAGRFEYDGALAGLFGSVVIRF
ncbi:MAG: hypothetical protein D6692_00040 [Planctomycetota bacterium]|nr:MAG: hypothetical protein D6692_00040 [Planctomycetota bacterium]